MIIKGAMDTTVPVMGVIVQVVNASGTANYPVQVNGKYFAAQVPVAVDSNIITVIATDQNSVQHQTSISVTATVQADNVTLTAAPGTGIMTEKQGGVTSLDVALSASTAMSNPIATYALDFSGSGTTEVTCYSHSGLTASYQHTGLYLTQVNATDTAGTTYSDTTIVNVSDFDALKVVLTQVWDGMKTALLSGAVETALGNVIDSKKDLYRTMFTEIGLSNIQSLLSTNLGFELESFNGNSAECGIIREENSEVYSYPISFTKDASGAWKIRGF